MCIGETITIGGKKLGNPLDEGYNENSAVAQKNK